MSEAHQAAAAARPRSEKGTFLPKSATVEAAPAPAPEPTAVLPKPTYQSGESPSKGDQLRSKAQEDFAAARREAEIAGDELLKGFFGDDEEPAPAQEAIEQPEPEAAQEESTVEETEGEPAAEEPAEDQELEKALRVLRYLKLPQKAIDAMGREEAISVAQHESRRSADLQRAKAQEQQAAQAAIQEESTEQVDLPAVDLAELARPVAELLDPEALPVVQKAFQGVFDAATKAMQAKLQEQGKRLATVSNVASDLLENLHRTRLQVRYPQAGDDESWKALRAKASTLAKTGDYSSLEDAFADAAAVLRWSDAPTKSTKSATARQRSDGQPMTDRRVPQPRAKSAEEREMDVLGILLNGDPDDPQVQAAARRAWTG